MIYNDSKYNKDWPVKKLRDLGIFGRGVSKHRPRNDEALFVGGGYPLVQTSEVKNSNLYIVRHAAEYNDFGLSQSRLWDPGTLCITIAANIADTSILSYPMCFPDSIVGFTADKRYVSPEYMYYVFAYIKNSILNAVSGSIQDNINLEMLESLSFRVPEKSYQTKVLSILASIDKKINNNAIIQEKLEDLAKTIYEYWFFQFDFPDENGNPYKTSGGKMVYNEMLKREIPDGWKVESLINNSISKPVKNGIDNFSGKKIYLATANINNEDIVDGDLIDFEGRESRANMQPGENQVWFAKMKASVKHLTIPDESDYFNSSYILSTGFYGISCDRNALAYLHCFINNPWFETKKDTIAHGATQQAVNDMDLKEIKLLIPEKRVLDQFSEVIYPVLKMKFSNMLECKKLNDFRDFLLPLLMNGQAKIIE